MSLANIHKVINKLHPSEVQRAAVQMEMDQANQFRATWERVENTNTEKLEKLLSNVKKITQRANSPVCKAQVRANDFIFNTLPGFALGFMLAPFGASCLGLYAGKMVSQQPLIPLLGGVIGAIGVISVGVACAVTASKYDESDKKAQHTKLFRLLPELSDTSNPKLNTCIQKLYHIGANEAIPGLFWERCHTLLEEISQSSKAYTIQQQRAHNRLEEFNEISLQEQQSKSFTQRHQNFVDVKMEVAQENTAAIASLNPTPVKI